MRAAVTLVILVILVLAAAGAVAVTGQGQLAKIDLTTTVGAERTSPTPGVTGAHRTTFLQLWNLAKNPEPIGYAVVTCVLVGKGGVYGSGREMCNSVYTLPLGKITATGLRASSRRYWLVITGGTRHYIGVAGNVHHDFRYLNLRVKMDND